MLVIWELLDRKDDMRLEKVLFNLNFLVYIIVLDREDKNIKKIGRERMF